MERRTKEEDSENRREEHSSTLENIRKLAAYNARASLNSEDQLLLFLQSWWSRTYNRPLKDPMLLSYSMEELLYEFYDRIERQAAAKEDLESVDDKIEEEKEQGVLDWAEQEEKKELELEALKTAAKPSLSKDPTQDPVNVAWMEEQIEKAKEVYGDDFGDNIDEDFSGQ